MDLSDGQKNDRDASLFVLSFPLTISSPIGSLFFLFLSSLKVQLADQPEIAWHNGMWHLMQTGMDVNSIQYSENSSHMLQYQGASYRRRNLQTEPRSILNLHMRSCFIFNEKMGHGVFACSSKKKNLHAKGPCNLELCFH